MIIVLVKYIFHLSKLYNVSCKIKYMELKFNEISLSFDFKILFMITVCKLNGNEMSLNFNSIYLILQLTFYSILK
jgi:hypothetical protein